MINILIIIDCYKHPYAGTESQVLKLIKGLDRKRFNSQLVILRDSFYYKGNDIPVKSDIPVPADILNIGGLMSIFSWIRLYAYLRKKKKEKFRIAHTFFFDSAMICPPLLKLLGYRVIVSRRDMGYWYTMMTLFVLRLNALIVDRVVANSRAVKDITMRKERYPVEKVEVIYNGYQDTSIQNAINASDLKLGEDEFRIVIVANIRPIKRIQDAIRALGAIRDIVPTAVLYVIGEGDTDGLESVAYECRVVRRVRFLGSRIGRLLEYDH
jgi:glycosyltransferase involved in cell wall biosynthesis